MNGYATLEAIAEELRDLLCRQKELGAAALEAIRHADGDLAGLLLEAFGSDDERAGMWLAQPSLLMDTTPIEQLAVGRRTSVVRALVCFIQSGKEAKLLRNKLGLNQSEFWSRISVTQSGGSRYESGRSLPKPVLLLLHLAYAPEKKSLAMLRYLRRDKGV